MTRGSDSARTALQVLGIACGIAFLSMIAHKGYADISLLARQHSGEKFWWALARYCVNNLAGVGAAAAQDITIDKLEQFTENRGWNEAGVGPTYQIVLSATVVPSGFPTLVFAEQGGVREPFTHYPQPSTPDLYVHWKRFDPALTGVWRIVAERGDAKGAVALTPVLAKAQQVPLVSGLRVAGKGAEPRLTWTLPELGGFDVERIRVAVRGGARVHGRFLSVLYVSGDLPPTATSFRIPAGVLARGERYVFQVMLEDLEGGQLANRSLSFSEPYTVSP